MPLINHLSKHNYNTRDLIKTNYLFGKTVFLLHDEHIVVYTVHNMYIRVHYC